MLYQHHSAGLTNHLPRPLSGAPRLPNRMRCHFTAHFLSPPLSPLVPYRGGIFHRRQSDRLTKVFAGNTEVAAVSVELAGGLGQKANQMAQAAPVYSAVFIIRPPPLSTGFNAIFDFETTTYVLVFMTYFFFSNDSKSCRWFSGISFPFQYIPYQYSSIYPSVDTWRCSPDDS